MVSGFRNETQRVSQGVRYVEDATERGIFTPIDPGIIQQKLEEHTETIPTDEACCYCTACDASLEAGGKNAINILELISGKFRPE